MFSPLPGNMKISAQKNPEVTRKKVFKHLLEYRWGKRFINLNSEKKNKIFLKCFDMFFGHKTNFIMKLFELRTSYQYQ